MLGFFKQRKPVEVAMVPIGGARWVGDIIRPFEITNGRHTIRMTVEEAEEVRDALNELLARPDCRRPIYVTVSTDPNNQ